LPLIPYLHLNDKIVASKWWARAGSFSSIRLFAGMFGNEGRLNYEFAHPTGLMAQQNFKCNWKMKPFG
jgi:hypothetical protein